MSLFWGFLFSGKRFYQFWDIRQPNFAKKPEKPHATVPKTDILIFGINILPVLGHPTKYGLVLFFKLETRLNGMCIPILTMNKKN
jgi:hypothetical protein